MYLSLREASRRRGLVVWAVPGLALNSEMAVTMGGSWLMV